MKKILSILLLTVYPLMVLANNNCVYKDEIEITTKVKIKKFEIIDEYSVDLDNRQRKCISKFKIKTKKWKKLQGEYIYSTNISEDQACSNARKLAIQNYIENNFENIVTNFQLLNCNEVNTNREVIQLDNIEVNNNEKKINFIKRLWSELNKETKDDIITSLTMYVFGL